MNKLDVLKILMEHIAVTTDIQTNAFGKQSLKVALNVRLENEWYEFSSDCLPLDEIPGLKN